MTTLETIITSSIVHLVPERYVIGCVSNQNHAMDGSFFMVSRDEDETTVIVAENKVTDWEFVKEEKWFRLIQINVSLPFQGVGFLATIARAVAGRNINIFVVSTFSRDYVLVREADAQESLKALEGLGFPIQEWA